MRGFIGLVRQDSVRIVVRRRTWLLSAAFAVVGIAWIFANRGSTYVLPTGSLRPTGPMLAIGAIDSLAGLVLFAPLLLGGSLAEDRVSGQYQLLLSRCGSRVAWVSSKFTSIGIVAFAFFCVSGSLLTGVAAAVGGWEDTSFAATVGVRTGLDSHPAALIAASCAALALAATATASLSCVAAFFVRSPAVSLVAPLIAIFAAALALPAPLNPYVRAGFLGVFFEWNSLSAVCAYWSALLAASWMSALVLSRAREE